MTTPIEPVHVHIASSDVAGTPRRAERTVSFYTVVLTADQPFEQILQRSPNRHIAYIQTAGADVVLVRSQGEAQAKANIGDPTYAAPTGIVVPYGNTTPYPLPTTSEVWAVSATYPAQVCVTDITEA